MIVQLQSDVLGYRALVISPTRLSHNDCYRQRALLFGLYVYRNFSTAARFEAYQKPVTAHRGTQKTQIIRIEIMQK